MATMLHDLLVALDVTVRQVILALVLGANVPMLLEAKVSFACNLRFALQGATFGHDIAVDWDIGRAIRRVIFACVLWADLPLFLKARVGTILLPRFFLCQLFLGRLFLRRLGTFLLAARLHLLPRIAKARVSVASILGGVPLVLKTLVIAILTAAFVHGIGVVSDRRGAVLGIQAALVQVCHSLGNVPRLNEAGVIFPPFFERVVFVGMGKRMGRDGITPVAAGHSRRVLKQRRLVVLRLWAGSCSNAARPGSALFLG